MDSRQTDPRATGLIAARHKTVREKKSYPCFSRELMRSWSFYFYLFIIPLSRCHTHDHRCLLAGPCFAYISHRRVCPIHGQWAPLHIYAHCEIPASAQVLYVLRFSLCGYKQGYSAFPSPSCTTRRYLCRTYLTLPTYLKHQLFSFCFFLTSICMHAPRKMNAWTT